jgi:GNAT superfamily N-acetyltransferase
MSFQVRRFEPVDAAEVQRIWTNGFLDMANDLTRTLGAVGSPDHSVAFPRPLLAAGAAAGTLRALVALFRSERSTRARVLLPGLGLAIASVAGLAFLHVVTKRAIRELCEHEIREGDMADIPSSWQRDGESQFFVAVEGPKLLGCIAVRRGGWRSQFSKAGSAPASATEEERDASGQECSVWKVSTATEARGRGVAKSLMLAAEDWARAHGGKRMVLCTASPGAKRFYSRLGYTMDGGSMSGAAFSSWVKTL